MNCLWRRIPCSVRSLQIVKSKYIKKTIHNSACQNHVNTTFTASLRPQYCIQGFLRHKSNKAKYDSDDEEVELDDDASLKKDSKVIKFNTTSLRTDLILKSALGIARNKIEQQFYESRIRVNGKKIVKKSSTVRIGDEIDVIKMVSPKNKNHLNVARVEIINMTAKEDQIAVTARRFKNLLIENYEDDPFKEFLSQAPFQLTAADLYWVVRTKR